MRGGGSSAPFDRVSYAAPCIRPSFWSLIKGAMTRIGPSALVAAAMLLSACTGPTEPHADSAGPAEPYLVYFGTSTGSGSEGIYVSRFDAASEEIGEPALAAAIETPNFLEIHPNQRFLYAASRRTKEDGSLLGIVAAFEIDHESGKLTPLNEVSSQGEGPCHVAVDSQGRLVAVANYTSGTVAVMPIQPDGSLGESRSWVQHEGSSVNPDRQQEPHAHSVNFSHNDRYLVAADLGTDKLEIYRVDPAAGEVVSNDPSSASVEPGSGPRHFTFHPSGRFAYAINELASTITAFAWDAERGALEEVHTVSTLPDGFSGRSTTAEVLAHPSGKFLYGSNRGHDSIAIFRIDEATGELTPSGHVSTHGETPRNFRLDPSGKYLFVANQNSGTIVLFEIDQQSGQLTPTGRKLEVANPMCIRFVKLG